MQNPIFVKYFTQIREISNYEIKFLLFFASANNFFILKPPFSIPFPCFPYTALYLHIYAISTIGQPNRVEKNHYTIPHWPSNTPPVFYKGKIRGASDFLIAKTRQTDNQSTGSSLFSKSVFCQINCFTYPAILSA